MQLGGWWEVIELEPFDLVKLVRLPVLYLVRVHEDFKVQGNPV